MLRTCCGFATGKLVYWILALTELLVLIFYEIKENSDLAGDRSKYPVTSPRGVAEERQSQNEEFVGQSQVPDVVVANKILLQTFVVVANGAITYR